MKYEYLNRMRITIHNDQQVHISKKTLKEISEYADFEFYTKEKMLEISEKGLIQEEINKLINMMLKIRKEEPEGSNKECLCMDQINEFIGKLDMVDFRKLKIEKLIDSDGAGKK